LILYGAGEPAAGEQAEEEQDVEDLIGCDEEASVEPDIGNLIV